MSSPPVRAHKAQTSAVRMIHSPITSSSTEIFESPRQLNVRVERAFPPHSMREQWDAAVVEFGASIYSSYDWCRTWWEFYGDRNELRIFLFYASEKLVGVIPIYIQELGCWPLRFKVARLVCASIPPKAFQLALDPTWIKEAFDSLLHELLGNDGCDLISIGPVSGREGKLVQCEAVARNQNAIVALTRESVHTVFDLPGSLDEFFEGIEKDERKKRKYEMRLLGKESSVARDVITEPSRVEAEFEAFAALHASQWREKGKLGHFGSWPLGRAYNLALVRALSKLGRVRFIRILAEGQVISNQFAFVFGDTWFWELPARLMDRKWNRFSLGTTGFFTLVEQAIKEGSAHIEGGIAHYDYKQKLNGNEHALEVLRVIPNRPASRIRNFVFASFRAFFRVVYFKIWYARLSPRLPAVFHAPLSRFWLSLDF